MTPTVLAREQGVNEELTIVLQWYPQQKGCKSCQICSTSSFLSLAWWRCWTWVEQSHMHKNVTNTLTRTDLAGVGLLVACLTSKQHARVSQGRTCTDNCMCCHIEIEVPDQTFYLTQSQYTDTGSTSPSADPIMPGAWQGSHWSANF